MHLRTINHLVRGIVDIMIGMNREQAIEELFYQSGRHEDVESPRWTYGFLGMLRRFQGQLFEENFHNIIRALYVLSEDIAQDEVRNEIIASIWGICHLARAWAVYPEGLLQSNNVISTEQVTQIEGWIEQISYITFCLLDGCGVEIAFEFYEVKYGDLDSECSPLHE